MKVQKDTLANKLKFLEFGISKGTTTDIAGYTKMIRFETQEDVVYAYTYNGENNISIKVGTTTKPINVIVEFEIFSKLLNSCEGDVTLTEMAKFLEIKADNLACKLPIYNEKTASADGGIPTPFSPNYPYDRTTDLSDVPLKILHPILEKKDTPDEYDMIYFDDFVLVSNCEDVVLIKNKRYFTENLFLSEACVSFLAGLTNVRYNFVVKTKDTHRCKFLCVMSDEICATFPVKTPEDNPDFQVDAHIELFNTYLGEHTVIDAKKLAKALNTGTLFQLTPYLVFDSKGVSLQISSGGFHYVIDTNPCSSERKILFPYEWAKKVSGLGEQVTVYYMGDGLLHFDTPEVAEIISFSEETNEK